MFATLTTARMTLRAPRPDDATALTDAIGNYDVVRWLGRVPYPYGVADARAFIDRAQPGKTWLMWENDVLIGGISVGDELGFWLARGAWGRGLATEACDAVIDTYFADPAAGPLEAGHYDGNDRSARVLIKQGFRYVGTKQVTAKALHQPLLSRVMELRRDEWHARRTYRLTTPRLTIRELGLGDVPSLIRIAGQPRVAQMMFNITVPWPESAAQRWVLAARYRGRLGFRAAICRQGVLIGVIGIGQVPGRSTVTCMYFIDPAHWGQGYAKEALVHFLNDTMARFHVETIWADHFDDNPASGAVLRHAGFTPQRASTGTSVVRDGPCATTIYCLNRSDLRAV
ncbi:GNAT family N-acetyltransferase [Oceaniglobus ichthyenteri]|uniref:GNAT family N-acetyltransferase n=1 Tax=Oceaniglobus ichthyenteri TaxID=2136177 RepID=UPI000D3D691A|nr:GNAT family N-acetyltransferase [Oceaniglobus ichthyenteri]